METATTSLKNANRALLWLGPRAWAAVASTSLAVFCALAQAAPVVDFSYAPTVSDGGGLSDSLGWPGAGREFGQSFAVTRSGRLAKFDFKLLTTESLPASGNIVISVYEYTLNQQSVPMIAALPIISGSMPITSLPRNTIQFAQPSGFMAVPWTSIALPEPGLQVTAGSRYIVALRSDVPLPGGTIATAGGQGPNDGTSFRTERDVSSPTWGYPGYGWFLQSYVDAPSAQPLVNPVRGGLAYTQCVGLTDGHYITAQWAGSYGGADSARCVGSGGHPGLDVDDSRAGEPVYTIAPGTVVVRKVQYRRGDGWGRYVVIRHDGVAFDGCTTCTYYSVYAHLATIDALLPEVGQSVGQDRVLGTIGNSGLELAGRPSSTSGTHLHFQVQATWNSDTDRPYWPTYTLRGGRQVPYPSGWCLIGWCDFTLLSTAQRAEAARNVMANTIDPLGFLRDARIGQ